MSSWAKFHQRHGSIASKKPQQIYGSYISDPRQYERSAAKKASLLSKLVSCLGCLVGRGGMNQNNHSRSKMQQNIDTRYMYNMSSMSNEYDNRFESMPMVERYPAPRPSSGLKRNKSRGNINYLQ